MTRRLGASLLAILLAGCMAGCPQRVESSPTPAVMTTSRLAKESSPYLRQHADNAVDWYPWGEEALRKAREEQKPIFLSIGYSTCHWCHVMEEESFMNPEVGAYLNQHYVSIKVDRETRPDVDNVYMTFVQRTTGSGGWPLSVFLTPEGVPVFGGTYFPQPAQHGRIGFLDLLKKFHQTWIEEKDKLVSSSGEFAQELAQEQEFYRSQGVPPQSVLSRAVKDWQVRFDEQYGGFGGQPKFPSPPELDFLLRYGTEHPDSAARGMALRTLRAIAMGGIRDHLEGGFHRYSTDRKWLVPHFEKMLYDQAQLLSLYSQAYADSNDPFLADAVESTLHYLDQRLHRTEGGYYSAEDADSALPDNPKEHAEGAFYVWSWSQLEQALTPQELETASQLLGVREDGNAGESDPTGELRGENVLFLGQPELGEKGRALLSKLEKARSGRPRPHRDEKVLTEWNAMLARGYLAAGRHLKRPEIVERASDLLSFLESALVVDGDLQRSYFEGRAEVPAFASDHAQMVAAYLDLFQATGEPKALERALYWQAEMDKLFWDSKAGGYFNTRADSELVHRAKSWQDGAVPCANSVAALNLQTLFALTGTAEYTRKLEELLTASGEIIQRSPTAVPTELSALQLYYGANSSLLFLSEEPEWQRELVSVYKPGMVLIPVTSKADREKLATRISHLPQWSSRSAAFLCRDFACQLPVFRLEEALVRAKDDPDKS